MTKAQALKLARGKWGERAAVRFQRSAQTKEGRERAWAELKGYRATKPTSFLAADDAREWRRKEDALISLAVSYRYRVGYISWAFFIQGSGDSWEEACRKAGLL